MTPGQRRAAVTHVRHELGVSERRACRALDQPGSTQQYWHRRVEKDKVLVGRLHELAERHPRYGYHSRSTRAGRGSPLCWHITAELRKEHWRVNRKRGQRWWRAEGLRIPTKTHKRTRLGDSENACHRRKPKHAHHVWAVDFLMDTTLNGGRLKILSVIDEFSRSCLSIKVERTLTSRDVVTELERLITLHGAPSFIRCDREAPRSDNGPEFIAQATRQFLATADIKTLLIDPGSPWQNGYSKSFNSRFRDEFLNLEAFTSTLEARVLSERWRRDHNEQRPHGALGYQTPKQVLDQALETGTLQAPRLTAAMAQA